jgi:hypothetical protein
MPEDLKDIILGLTSINDVLNTLETLQVDYTIYNPIIEILGREYVEKNLSDTRITMATNAVANSKKSLFREINIVPAIEYESPPTLTDHKQRPHYTFALLHGKNTSHIYVPELDTKRYFTNGKRSAVFTIAEHRGFRYMKKLGPLRNRQQLNYIYYDIETYESSDERKFKCNSVSILTVLCDRNLHEQEEKTLVHRLKSGELKSFCYLQKGVNDSIDDIKKRESETPNLHIVEEINLWKILEQQMNPDAMNFVISFNGARFDNLFLLKSIIENRIMVDTSISAGLIEINSSSSSNTCFRTMDIARLLGAPNTLEKFSNSFIKDISMRKVANKALFRTVNEKYREGFVLDDDNFIKEFIGYNNLDVESLMLIHSAMLRALTYITKDKTIESIMSSCISLAQFSMIWFRKGIKNLDYNKKPQKFPNDGKMPGLSSEDQKQQYDLLKTFKTGGRVQAEPTVVNDSKFSMASFDVASLYPFTMMCYNKGYFMAGALKPTNVYVEGKPGIYFGTVTQINNGNNEMGFFCQKSLIANDWDVFDSEIKGVVMTSHDIEEILKKKPHWQYTIDWGYYTDHQARGIDIFTSILPFMKEKAVQDSLAIIRDEKANTAIREMCKSVMNSLSGKFLQAVRKTEKQVLSYDVKELLIKNGSIQTVETLTKNNNDYLVESLKKDKMLHVGLFIYSLSKIYMYQNAYSICDNGMDTIIGKNEFVTTDTDSNKIVRKDVFDQWMELRGAKSMVDQIWPEVLNMDLGYSQDTKFFYSGQGIKCMGQYEDEYAGRNYNNAIYMGKKEYMVWHSNQDGKITHSTIKLKGVQATKLKILNSLSEDVGSTIDENKLFTIYYKDEKRDIDNKKIVKHYDIEEGYRKQNINGSWICLINKKIYSPEAKYWQSNNRLTDEIDALQYEAKSDHDAYVRKFIYIMQRKLSGQKTLVLTKTFKRDLDTQNIQNSFMIKRI